MPMATLQSLFKHGLVLSVLTMATVSFYKDKLPNPNFYNINSLVEPGQWETARQPFKSHAGGQEYLITPKYSYELTGVIVSYNNSGGVSDIWHHKRWKDFLNERDLCVIWGENVKSGIYRMMKFENDSWTCWAYWPDRETGEKFKKNALSNNHLLVDNAKIKEALMASEPGDQVHFRGILAEYKNPATGFNRGTSNNREDTGNGACETVYLTDFEVTKKANPGFRHVYAFAKAAAVISLIGFFVLFFITPVRVK